MNEIEVKQENFADVASGGLLQDDGAPAVDEDQDEMVVGIDADHINFLTSMASDDSMDCPPEVAEAGGHHGQGEYGGGDDDEEEDVMAAAESILQKTAKRNAGGAAAAAAAAAGGSQQFYHCQYCNKTFTWLKSLTVHLRTHTNVKPYKCELCDRSFVRSDYLKYHILKSHETTEQVFTCGACGGVFATNRGLLRHIRTEHEGHPTGDDELLNAAATAAVAAAGGAGSTESDSESIPEADENGKYCCTYCDDWYDSREPLVQHMRRHLGAKPFRCDLCSKSFIRADFLQCHRSNHLKNMDFRHNGVADGADAAAKRPRISLKKLEDLVPSASASRAESSEEDGGGGSDSDGESSSNEDEQQQQLQDQQLHQTEEQRSLLAALLTEVSKTENDRYQCPRCDKTFTQESTLKVHLRTHTGITPFKCPLCDLAFIRSDYLKNHLKKHIEDTGEDPGAPGSIDTSTFSSYNSSAFASTSGTTGSGVGSTGAGGGGSVSLLKPLSARPQSTGISLLKPPEERKPPDQPEYCIRTEDGKFMCTACERVFSHQQTVRIHYRIHTNEKPYKCPSCPESFIRSDYLERHMKVHWKDGMGVLPPLMIPSKSSSVVAAAAAASVGASDSSDSSPQKPTIGRAGLMPENYHFVEAGDGQYACKICDQVFSQSDSLRKHALTHTEEKPFFCDVCDRSFNRVDYLKEHFKSKRHRQALAEANGDAAMDEDDDSMTDTSLTGRMAKTKSPISPMTNAIADRMEFQRTEDGRYKCTDCDKTFVTAVTLKMHLRLHTGEKPYKCSRCSMAFIRSDYLKTHEKIHRQEAYLANQQFYSRDQSIASGDEYDEDQQEYDYAGMNHLGMDLNGAAMMMAQQQVKQDPELIIEGHGQSAVAPGLKREQEEEEEQERDDDDDDDDNGEEEEESEDEQVIEVMVKEEDSDDDDEEDEQGGEDDQNDENEEGGEEEEEHENNNSYENEDSTSRISGGIPSEQSSGPRARHRCHLCKKEFAWPKSLKIHLRTHTGERPYECEVCGKSFTRSDSLKAHRNTHGDVRVLQCHLCDASFVNDQRGLIRHQKKDHGIEPMYA